MKPRLNMRAYTVTRTTLAPPVAGRMVAGSTASIAITANVQPASGKDLKVLPEVRQGDDVRVIYTATELKIVGGAYDCDTITIDGDTFEVFKTEPWSGHHWRCFAARQVHP